MGLDFISLLSDHWLTHFLVQNTPTEHPGCAGSIPVRVNPEVTNMAAHPGPMRGGGRAGPAGSAQCGQPSSGAEASGLPSGGCAGRRKRNAPTACMHPQPVQPGMVTAPQEYAVQTSWPFRLGLCLLQPAKGTGLGLPVQAALGPQESDPHPHRKCLPAPA